MSKITDMINIKLTESKDKKKVDERKKFVVLLDDETHDQLIKLALATRSGKINFASAVLKIAMNEAMSAARSKGVDFDKVMSDDQAKRDAAAGVSSNEDPEPDGDD